MMEEWEDGGISGEKITCKRNTESEFIHNPLSGYISHSLMMKPK